MSIINNDFLKFDVVYVNNDVRGERVDRILNKLDSGTKIVYVDDVNELIRTHDAGSPHDRAKSLLLTQIRGDILKKCPGTHGHICCNYYVINLYIGCPIGCSYCILQSYLNQPFTIINTDIDNIFESLDNIFTTNKDRLYRIGTGESGDSLVYDYLTDFSTDFIEFFRKYDNVIFEFKTKTNFIDNILKIDAPKNIVVGFSVNPQDVIDAEEMHSASLRMRIEAMRSLTARGYQVALHFDPIVAIDDFDNKYEQCINDIMATISADKIAWISLGTFRYPAELKKMMDYNYPNSRLTSEEFILCDDKKFRYLIQDRLYYYSTIIKFLHKYRSDLPIYLCMESSLAWQKSLNCMPAENKNITNIFKMG